MGRNDQRGTPFKENIRNFIWAIQGKTRYNRGADGEPVPVDDGRGWFNAVTHEGKNVVVELWRALMEKISWRSIKRRLSKTFDI